MAPQIFILKFGINRCYIIQGEQAVMVDGGPPDRKKQFLKQLSKYQLDPQSIKLIILTHGDFDHIGSAKDFKELNGARVAIHEYDRKYLEEAILNWPPGVTAWGKASRFVLKPFVKGFKFTSLKPDIILSNEDFPLEEYGINGKIIHTPGHTRGSVSVVLNTGEAFAGCMAHNGFPFSPRPRLPIFATDIDTLAKSWHIILENGVKTIYPGHGNPFLVERIMKYIRNSTEDSKTGPDV